MSRIWVFLVTVGIVSLAFLGGRQIVLTTECVNSVCQLTASTSKPAIVAALCLWAFLPFYPHRPGRPHIFYPVTMWERAAAFFVDFTVCFIGTAPVLVLPALWAEAQATGEFRWGFQRDYARISDIVLVELPVLAALALVFGYFYAHSVLGRRTLGQYLLGYRLEGLPEADQPPAYALNILLGFVGAAVWPFSLALAAGRKDKAAWWNLRSRTRLVRVEM